MSTKRVAGTISNYTRWPMKPKQSVTVVCPKCGQRGDQRPGIRLGEFGVLEAVFVGDEAVPPPQRLTCRRCEHSWAIPRGTVEVR